MTEAPENIYAWNQYARDLAKSVIQSNGLSQVEHEASIQEVNAYGLKLNEHVYTETKHFLSQGKIVGIVGGDHSTPFGAIQAFLEKYPKMSVLHIDAHADLRKAFEGFEYSHASIMYNVMTKMPLTKLVQVGIRDFCEEEYHFIRDHHTKIKTFYDADIFEKKMQGIGWSVICDNIIQYLSQEVYISFDIDGLDPRFCPHTGTPVPGGLDFYEALYLIKKIINSGRKIIGFDLNEVSPGVGNIDKQANDAASEWDANVGARLLYKLCGYSLAGKK